MKQREKYVNSKNLIAIPYWIVDSFDRAGLRCADIVDYEVARKVLSVEDMASIVALDSIINDSRVISSSLGWIGDYWFESKQLVSVRNKDGHPLRQNFNPERQALFDTITTIGQSDAKIKEVQRRLQTSFRKEGEPTYTLIDAERSLGLLVCRPGFIDGLERPKFRYGLIKRVLKLLYVYFGSQSFEFPLYGAYIKLLQQLKDEQVSA